MNRGKIVDVILSTIEKISKLKLDELNVSDYNKRYLSEYCNNSKLFSSLYADLLLKSISKLTKPINQSTLVDYGGGCGLLSYTAKELGFKSVIYNDIYDVSVTDTQKISKALNSNIDFFICGDINEVLSTLENHQITPDIFSSFDVLEHIYDLKDWFNTFKTIDYPCSLCFMTSANGANLYVRKKLQKIHYQAEFVGKEKKYGWKERDSYLPFVEIRKNIIKEYKSDLDEITVEKLATKSRGLIKQDIKKIVDEYCAKETISYKLPYITNTCDPNTGNWAENIIDLKPFRKMLVDSQTKVKFTNSKYGYGSSKVANFIKFLLNLLIGVLGKENLFFSHTYTLELDYKK